MLGRKRKYNPTCLSFSFFIPSPPPLLPFYPSETTAFGEIDLGISCVLIRGSKCAGRKD